MEKSYRKAGPSLGWKLALGAVIRGGTAVNIAAEALTRLDHRIRKQAEMLACVSGYLGGEEGRQDQESIYNYLDGCDDRRAATENKISLLECQWEDHDVRDVEEVMSALLFYSLSDWLYAKWVESQG